MNDFEYAWAIIHEKLECYTDKKYIEPVINEIMEKYSIVNDSIVKHYFNCELVLKSNKNNNECICVSKEKDFFVSGLDSLKNLFHEISMSNYYWSTIPGELDNWEIAEKNNVLSAIKKELILKYT